MDTTLSALSLLVLAGIMNASFTLPMKFTRRWAWENIWLLWSIFALLLAPVTLTLLTLPHVAGVYRGAEPRVLAEVVGFGAGWGVAQVFFGLAVEAIGIALTFSLVMGVSAAAGMLAPFVRLHADQINTPAGHGALGSIALMLAGVSVCAFAGRLREGALELQSTGRSGTTRGLVLAVLCGLGASCVNLGIAFGGPLIDSAQSAGASPLVAANAVWLPLMLAGAVPNILYSCWLLGRNRSVGRFAEGGLGHWALVFVMAVFWFGSTSLYGLSVLRLGAWGPVLGWPLFMSLIIIVAGLLGMLTGEWSNSSVSALGIQWAGVAILVAAVFILAAISRHLS